MQYETPELVVLGPAAALVKGMPEGLFDSTGTPNEHPVADLAVGLED